MYASKIARPVAPVEPDYPGGMLIKLFERDPDLHIIAVVNAGRPVGLLTRQTLLQHFAQKFGRELWDRRPISQLMQVDPRAVRIDTPIDELCRMIAGMTPEALLQGVVFVDEEGCYAGVSSAFDLYRASVHVADDKNARLIAVTEQLSAETEKANAASRAKSEFLATMSHEIRTPLNGVLGMAQALAADNLAPDQRGKLDVILSSGETLTALLNDVLDLSKIEAGKLEISPVPSDLAAALGRATGLFQALADEKGLVLSLEREGPGPAWFGFDRVRIHQCVTNLISNAIKFTPQGHIWIRYGTWLAPDKRSHEIRISVTDTGIGMDEATQGRLFTAFTQADGSTTRRFGGTGLGLAITRRLARLMGGDVTVTSTPGQGSSFVLTFQAETVAPESESTEARPEAGAAPDYARPVRILLVDDNAINRQVARLFLSRIHCEIVEAANGAEALDQLAARAFDVVLLDVHMPVMDGCETIHHIRTSDEPWRNLPVIALTADAMEGDRERFVAMGMTDYLAKPIDRRLLLNAIHAATSRALPAPGGQVEPVNADNDLSDILGALDAAVA